MAMLVPRRPAFLFLLFFCWPLTAAAQPADSERLAQARLLHRWLYAAYPELTLRSLSFSISHTGDSTEMRVVDTSGLRSGFAVETAPLVLVVRAAFDTDRKIRALRSEGPLVRSEWNAALLAAARQRTSAGLDPADVLADAGIRFPLTNQTAVEQAAPWKRLTAVAGTLSLQSVTPVGLVAGTTEIDARHALLWRVLVSAHADGESFDLDFEPVSGRLVGVTRR